MAKYKQKVKEAYLEYYKRKRGTGEMPQPFGTWTRARGRGGSRRLQRQLTGLPKGLAGDIEKRFKRK